MQTFCSSYIFLLLINMLEAPPGTRTLKYARCSATVVPAEKLEPWTDIPEQFQNQTQQAQKEGTRTEGSNRYRGGLKKDTCGVKQTARLLLLEIVQCAKAPVTLPAATLCFSSRKT